MDPSTPARSALHYALKEFRKTIKDMIMHSETTIKKQTQHELELSV